MKRMLLLNNKGVSLMELLISMAILAILAVCFAAMFIPAVTLEGKAAVLNRDTASLATALEQVMDEKPASLPVGVADTGKTITLTFDDGGTPITIDGPGQVVKTTDPETGVNLETYVDKPDSP